MLSQNHGCTACINSKYHTGNGIVGSVLLLHQLHPKLGPRKCLCYEKIRCCAVLVSGKSIVRAWRYLGGGEAIGMYPAASGNKEVLHPAASGRA